MASCDNRNDYRENFYLFQIRRFEMEKECVPGAESNLHRADRLASGLYWSAREERYRDLTAEQLASVLDQAAAIQEDNGLIPLLIDAAMPTDCRIWLHYHPSYAVAVAGIYAWMNHKDIFDEDRTAFFVKLLDGCTTRRLYDHGIEATDGQRDILKIFIRAGVREFCEMNSTLCPKFTMMIQDLIRDIEDALKEGKKRKALVMDYDMKPYAVTAELEQIIAAYNGKPYTVFVYGTLMRRQRAHSLLKGSIYSRQYVLNGYELINLGAYPGIRKMTGASVLGEVYFVDKKTLHELDSYEDEGTPYHREEVRVESYQGKVFAFAYIYNGDSMALDASDCWKPRAKDEVWYACYGSNLSQDRFRCYIEGGTAVNGKTYAGCRDKTLWKEEYAKSYYGTLYFGNESPIWNGKGVAFFDQNGSDAVVFRLYRITREQLDDVQKQEGASPRWYGKKLLMGMGKDNLPVYTLTCDGARRKNDPAEEYLELIRSALKNELGMKKKEVDRYIKNALKWVR